MEDKEWLRFEKSGRIADYLTYCQSSVGRFTDFGTDRQGDERVTNGTDVYSDRNDPEFRSGGGI